MIVDLGADFFVAEPVGDSKAAAVNCEKVHFVVNVLSHGHFILPSKGLLDEIIDQAQRHGTQSMIELVKNATNLFSPSCSMRKLLTTICVNDYNKEQLTMLLFKPSELLVENAPHEWNVYRRMIHAYEKDATYGIGVFSYIGNRVRENMLVPENAGGCTNIEAMLNLKNDVKGEYRGLYRKKVCIIFDRDTDSDKVYDERNKRNLLESFTGKVYEDINDDDIYKLDFGNDYVWHMWYKREIENYLPESAYRARGVNIDLAISSPNGYDYYRFDHEDKRLNYNKKILQYMGTSLDCDYYNSSTKHFSVDRRDLSEMQLLLLKIAQIV